MKNLSKTVLAILATGLLSCGLFCQQTQAVPITGDIKFGGTVMYDTNSLATAKQVSSWNAFVTGTSGSFSTANGGVPFGNSVTLATPWVFNPGTSYSPLWSLTYNGGADSYSFNLLGPTVVIVMQSSTFLNITGAGMLFGTGFDATAGTWSFTSTTSGRRNTSSFGFTADTTAVPDGGTTVTLLGIAFVGLEGLRRKLKAA